MVASAPSSTPVPAPGQVRGAWPGFAAWAGVGALYTVSLLGALSIGLFVLPIAVVATLLLVRWHSAGASVAGVIAGLGLPLLLVAYLNRSGPGTVCTTTSGGGESCTDEWNPWPWLIAALALLAMGIAAFLLLRRQPHREGVA